MPRVKVCGLTRAADVDAAVAAGADALGFVTDVPVDTHREVAPARAADLAASAPPFATTVAVTIADGVDDAIAVAEAVDPDALQVHGDLPAADLEAVADAVPADLVVAVDADDPDRARDLDGVADALLVDSTTDAGAGGTGETHDWGRAADLRAALDAPFVLAGGLTPDNVAEAALTVAPFAVDVASGVEGGTPGEKDHDAVRRFVAEAGRGVSAGSATESASTDAGPGRGN